MLVIRLVLVNQFLVNIYLKNVQFTMFPRPALFFQGAHVTLAHFQLRQEVLQLFESRQAFPEVQTPKRGFGANFLEPNLYLCNLNHFLHLWAFPTTTHQMPPDLLFISAIHTSLIKWLHNMEKFEFGQRVIALWVSCNGVLEIIVTVLHIKAFMTKKADLLREY